MNKLDEVLHGWAKRAAGDERHDELLRMQILEQIVSRSPLSVLDPALTGTIVPSSSKRLLRSAVAVSACVITMSLMLAITFTLPHGDKLVVAIRGDEPQVENLRPLLTELDRLFGGHWRWLGEVNGKMDLRTDDVGMAVTGQTDLEQPTNRATPIDNHGNHQIDDERVRSEASLDEQTVAIRLEIVQRRPSQKEWKVVWQASVLTRTGEWVQLPHELTGEGTVAVWSHSLPDGTLLIESDIELTLPVKLKVAQPQIVLPSNPTVRLWSTRGSDGEFQLIQSSVRWEGQHG